MSPIGQPERATQNRVIALFRDELGYRYLGDWSDRPANSNIQEDLLTAYLTKAGHAPEQISRAIYLLRTEADNTHRSLYDNNQAVYSMLRYGVPVKIEAGKVTETVKVINWAQPEKNDFAIAEEVTLRGNHERRPNLVLYVNGIAVAVIELKNSHVSIGHGIRQLLSNQQKEFNEWFFATVQIVFAGNDSEGLRYGAIKTEEKYFLKWKEDEADNSRFKLDKYLLKMCRKDRLIELMHDFVLFDGGVKKLPSLAVGELFVFVDECHRTQSGKLHKTMKAMLPGAVFIGFTGTPLLKQDKQTSLEVFGGYIHTYKFNEGVEDGVVLDLIYEARDIEQSLGSQDKIDAWFEAKTKALNDWQKAALREQWGTMQKVLSSRSRMERVVSDIIFDFIKAALLPLLGVKVERFFVQRMRTKWGSCNPGTRSIRLNTDLAKKPRECLEYIVVHEMVHLLEPTHNTRFVKLMDQFMPKWQFYRQILNRLPVRHQSWDY